MYRYDTVLEYEKREEKKKKRKKKKKKKKKKTDRKITDSCGLPSEREWERE